MKKSIETERLILRSYTLDDAEAGFVWMGDPKVNKYMQYGLYKSVDEVKAWIESLKQLPPTSHEFVIVQKETGAVIGGAGIRWNTERGAWVFGYNLAAAYWGKGYATEATRAMIDFVRRTERGTVFESEAALENTASRRVIEKCGLSEYAPTTYTKLDGSATFDAMIYRGVFEEEPCKSDENRNALSFRSATESDADEICSLIQSAATEMNAHGIDQWDEVYPEREDVLYDIEQNTLRVGEIMANGKTRIAVFYTLNHESDAEYDGANWQHKGAYRVLHRLCVHPDFQRRGIATLALCHAEEEARESGAESIRLDVFSKNPFSLRLYEKAGYTKTGEARWRKGLFYLMEKPLVPETAESETSQKSLTLGLKRGTVALVPHQTEWEREAERIIGILKTVFADDAADIQHVGSTAIRTISAKPIVDIAVAVRGMDCTERHIAQLSQNGIVFCGEDVPGQRLFVIGDFEADIRTAHIHIVLHESSAWRNYIRFRDYLNAHPDTAREYEVLKQKLAAQFSNDRAAYTDGKQAFVESVLRMAKNDEGVVPPQDESQSDPETIINYFDSDRREHWKAQIARSNWGAADLLVRLLDEGTFFDTLGAGSRLYLLTRGDTLISYATLSEQDCVRDPTMKPWIGFVFTFPAFRGNHASFRLIDHICADAARLGYTQVYVATDHVGLYEKCGFAFVEKRTDVYGEECRVLLRRDLKGGHAKL